MAFLWLLPSEHKANETKDNKNGTSPFAELKPLYANSVWITKTSSKRIFESYIWKSRQTKNSWKISPYIPPPYVDVDVTTVCRTGLSLMAQFSDNVSEPTMTPAILSFTSLSESEVEVSLQSAVSFFKPNKILLAICAFIYGMPLSLTSSP